VDVTLFLTGQSEWLVVYNCICIADAADDDEPVMRIHRTVNYLRLLLSLGHIECWRCSLLRLMIMTSVSVLCGFAVQTWLNGSRSCLGWGLSGTQGT